MFLNPGNVLSWATFFPLLGRPRSSSCSRSAASRTSRTKLDRRRRAPHRARDERAVLRGGHRGLADVRPETGVQLAHHFVWIRAFNIEYYVGVDGLSISMVLLSGLISFIATIASMPWWSGARAGWPAWSRRRRRTTTRTTRSTSRCGWCPATWSCCCSCRRA